MGFEGAGSLARKAEVTCDKISGRPCLNVRCREFFRRIWRLSTAAFGGGIASMPRRYRGRLLAPSPIRKISVLVQLALLVALIILDI